MDAAELFVSEASAAMKDRMPYVEDGPDGRDGRPKRGLTSASGTASDPADKSLYRAKTSVDTWPRPACSKMAKRNPTRFRSAHATQGNGTRRRRCRSYFWYPGSAKMQDPEAIHMFRIYNDWLVDFAATIQASTSASPACRMAIFPRRSTKFTAARNAYAGWNCPCPGTWSRCGIHAGSALGSGQRG